MNDTLKKRPTTLRLRRKLTMFAAAMLLSVIVIECILQLLTATSQTVRWTLTPPWQQQPMIDDDALEHRGNPRFPEHDRLGFRNPTTPTSCDIVALGDSQTYGTSVRTHQSWPRQLAEMTDVEIYNMAFGGWGPVQYLAVLDQALAFGPKLIVVGLYFGNDIFDAYRAGYSLPIGRPLRNPEKQDALQQLEHADPLIDRINQLCNLALRLEEHSTPATQPRTTTTDAPRPPTNIRQKISSHSKLYALLRALKTRISGTGHYVSRRDLTFTDTQWQQWLNWADQHSDHLLAITSEPNKTILTWRYRAQAVDLSDPRLTEGLELINRAIEKLNQRCSQAGCDLLILLIPTKELLLAPLVAPSQLPDDYNTMILHETTASQTVRRFLSANKIPYVDALPAMREQLTAASSLYHPSSDGHPSPFGHKVIARALCDHALVKKHARPPANVR